MSGTLIHKKIILESSTGFIWALFVFGAGELTRLLLYPIFLLLVPILTGFLFTWYLIKITEGSNGWNKLARSIIIFGGHFILVGWLFRVFIVLNPTDWFIVKDIIILLIFTASCSITFAIRQTLNGTK